MIYLMPESPRYLMKHGRYEKALDSFTQIQTTPLLAARDLMYAHAQLDFESRMLKGNANEFGNLEDRVDPNMHNISGGATGPRRTVHNDSVTSISPRQSIEMVQVGSNAAPEAREQPRDSHQDQNAELASTVGRASTNSSLEIELAIRAAVESSIKKENPYSYHIGVTGYYKRLGELWRNMRCRRALLASSVAMISQQMTGVRTLVGYPQDLG
jgi:hypothetical protein